MTPNTKGALFMMCSMAAFTINDTFIKATNGALPLFQVLTMRGILSTVLIFVLAWRLGGLDFRMSRKDAILVGLRSLSETAAAYFFLTALFHLPLATVTATLQALPLTVTLGAALFFREPVGWRRALAILAGFCGMLLIVRPGPDGFNLYASYALFAVVFITARDLTTRRMSGAVHSMTVTFCSSSAVLVFSAVLMTREEWVPMEPVHWALVLGSAVFVFGGYLFSVLVMRIGDVSFVAPFRYTGLLWALLLGWLVFGDWPDNVTMIGAAIVVATGLFALYRERIASRG